MIYQKELKNKAEYDLILGHGMPVLDMHIPSGGGMTSEESERSFRLAKQFFTEHSGSDNMPAAIVCSSWIFNPNLPEILPPESNLVRLLKRVHPIPRASTKNHLCSILCHSMYVILSVVCICRIYAGFHVLQKSIH